MSKELDRLNKSFYSAWFASRVMGLGFLVMSCAFLVMCAAFIYLMPLKEIKPYLVSSYNKDSQVVKVEPLEVNTEAMKKLMGIKCREFITDLHTIDGQTETLRLKRLSLMVVEDIKPVVDNFLNVESQNSIAKKLIEAQISRSVNIKHIVNLAPDAPNKWQIQWESLEVEKEAHRRTHFVSIITAEAQERAFHAGEDDINPIGFTVTQYAVRMISND